MTPEQQHIALAEWAGEDTGAVCPNHGTVSDNRLMDGMSCPWCGSYCEREYGDYLNDLNAVHELEKKLTNEEFQFFDGLLLEIVSRDYVTKATGRMVDRASTHATAAQRCEALLRTLNLWTL